MMGILTTAKHPLSYLPAYLSLYPNLTIQSDLFTSGRQHQRRRLPPPLPLLPPAAPAPAPAAAAAAATNCASIASSSAVGYSPRSTRWRSLYLWWEKCEVGGMGLGPFDGGERLDSTRLESSIICRDRETEERQSDVRLYIYIHT